MINTRTGNSMKNIITAFVNQGLVTILTFITRTILVKQLGAEYVGINGLFTNIISMLSLADLGIGLAIPYSLYKPLSEHDNRKIIALMQLYSKIYTTIGVFILVVGSALAPMLHLFVKEMPDISHIRYIYILFVFNSGISYFFSYKSLLITSDQKAYVITGIKNIISITLAVSQCLALIITSNYIAYLLCNTVLTLVQNLIISYQCNKRYPYIKSKTREKLSSDELKEIKTNVFSVCLYKIGVVLLNGTDSIFISKFISVVVAGAYSNYLMITNALSSILSNISGGFNASIGNATVTENNDYNLKIYQNIDFINYWLYGVCTITLFSMFDSFITVWIGEEYCLNTLAIWAISMNFYTLGMQNVNSAFRNAYGLFYHGKLRPLVMASINIMLDFILVEKLGVFGIILATLIARITTTVWYDPYIVYKHGLKKSCKKYYFTYIIRFIIVNILGFMAFKVVETININSWLRWIVAGCSVFIVVNIVFIIFYSRTAEYLYLKEKITSIVSKFIKKKS